MVPVIVLLKYSLAKTTVLKLKVNEADQKQYCDGSVMASDVSIVIL